MHSKLRTTGVRLPYSILTAAPGIARLITFSLAPVLKPYPKFSPAINLGLMKYSDRSNNGLIHASVRPARLYVIYRIDIECTTLLMVSFLMRTGGFSGRMDWLWRILPKALGGQYNKRLTFTHALLCVEYVLTGLSSCFRSHRNYRFMWNTVAEELLPGRQMS